MRCSNTVAPAASPDIEVGPRQTRTLNAVARLAGGVAHNFNNLLTTITLMTDLLMQDLSADDKSRADLAEIKKAGDRAALLTRQLLAFSGQQPRQPTLVDLNALIGDVALTLGEVLGANIEVRLDPAQDLPSVKADSGQLVQVLVNLAVNARDAMPDGGVLELRTRVLSLSSEQAGQLEIATSGPCVALTVSDNGVGMDAEVQQHVFEPFFTTKEIGKGTGLGLATVYGIVKQSGGAIALESEPGKGARFTILLPPADIDA
jgi:two-component system, cell cycle sensor histidine kinase and response regulator CckA